MGSKHEAGNNAEVPAATLQRPKEIGILCPGSSDKPTVCENHVGLDQIVDGQAVLATEIAMTRPPKVRPATPVVEIIPKGTA